MAGLTVSSVLGALRVRPSRNRPRYGRNYLVRIDCAADAFGMPQVCIRIGEVGLPERGRAGRSPRRVSRLVTTMDRNSAFSVSGRGNHRLERGMSDHGVAGFGQT